MEYKAGLYGRTTHVVFFVFDFVFILTEAKHTVNVHCRDECLSHSKWWSGNEILHSKWWLGNEILLSFSFLKENNVLL